MRDEAGVRTPVLPDEIVIELAADTSFGLTARVLVAAAARHFGLDDGSVEDLRIAVSELFSCAVEAKGGPVRIVVGRIEDDVVLRVSGTGPVDTGLSTDRGGGPFVSRADLLRALFSETRFTSDDGGTAVIAARIAT